MNGDTLFNINLKIIVFTYTEKSKLTIALKEVSKTDRFGKVTLGESNLITSVSEKKNVGFGLINGGIYLMNKAYLKTKKLLIFIWTNILEKVKENIFRVNF